jgi:hypothetical protein
VREELGVHVQLTDATRNELGELAPEVEHHDGIGLLGRLGLDALRRGCMERLLEVGLDLGVVGGEDAVTGVGGLPVDGAPALLRRSPWLGRDVVAVAQCRSVSARVDVP